LGVGRAAYPPGDWDYITTVPARGEESYNVVAPTLCDSTPEGICWSVFFVSAITADPLVFFDAEPDSGYSVDNLAPSAPLNLHLPEDDLLAWDPVPDEDFNYYSVYTSESEDFAEYELLGTTTDVVMDVTGTAGLFLAVSAKDFSENESELSTVLYNPTAANDGVPARFALFQNRPNPFNPRTEIRFALPEAAEVSLLVFDLSGRCVRQLIVEGSYGAGVHSSTWDGLDDRGRQLASGVYFYRLDTAAFSETRKMLLIK
jgi:hypothetical protein